MSEEAEGLEATPEPAPEPQESQDPQHTPEESKAMENGWAPKEEWRGNADKWCSAEVFNERSSWLERTKGTNDRISAIERSFERRLDNTNKLHEQQMTVQKAELVRKRDEAIDGADRETANKYQNDIDTLNTPVVTDPPANNDQAFLDNWNASNPWVMGNDPKAAYAKQQFSAYSARGMTQEQSIQAMQTDVDKAFPALNPNRETQPVTEGGTKPGGKRGQVKLSMGDLTSDERKFHQAMPGAWKNDAEFLQAVQDTRSAK